MEMQYFINPVDDSIIDLILSLPEESIGKSIEVRTEDTYTDIPAGAIAIIGVPDDRGAVDNPGTGMDLMHVRKAFYGFFKGNWQTPIYDLGNIRIGGDVADTGKIIREITGYGIQHGIIPVFLGGSHAYTYYIYRAFDTLEERVNLTVIDPKFDLGNEPDTFHSRSYLQRIILEEPYNLHHYTNLGYQTFVNARSEIKLMKQMYFDTYRLGEIRSYLPRAEAALRESHIVSVDMGAVRQSDAPGNRNALVSGFNGDEICTLTRYAGLSDGVKVLGIFEYNSRYDRNHITAGLLAQMLWYFIEGVNYRIKEYPNRNLEGFKKYIVPIEGTELIFFKSHRTQRWWMEILTKNDDNKNPGHTLIPCTQRDFQTAMNGDFPEIWYVNKIKRQG